MKKTILALVFAAALAFSANAQPYDNAVGAFFAPSWNSPDHSIGLQWKHFLTEKNALDIRAEYTLRWGPEFCAMYDWNFALGDKGFYFCAGPGVHFGIVKDYDGGGNNCADFGFTGTAGFEYVFSGVPLALSIDWHPFLTWEPKVDNKALFGYKEVDFGVKYCF